MLLLHDKSWKETIQSFIPMYDINSVVFVDSFLSDQGFLGGLDSKESACNVGDLGLTPGSGRSPGEGNGNLLQYSCLESSTGPCSLVGYSPWGRYESDVTERLHFHFPLSRNGEGNGNPLQCSCLENPMDRGAWQAPVHKVTRVGHDLTSSQQQKLIGEDLCVCCVSVRVFV